MQTMATDYQKVMQVRTVLAALGTALYSVSHLFVSQVHGCPCDVCTQFIFAPLSSPHMILQQANRSDHLSSR